jgi:hypothetical protein
MHEAELMGYPAGKVTGETQHAFMDDVRSRAIKLANEKKLGGADDWTTGTAQAAAWSGNKIRRGDISPGEAAKSYADYLPLHEANATYEAVSAPVTGHLSGLLNAPWETKVGYMNHPAGSWNTSPSGRDVAYTAARLLPGETAPAAGRFEGMSNPAMVARPVVGTETLADKSRAMTPGSKSALDAVEAARAYFDAQAAGAWHKVMPARSAADYSAATLNFGRPLTEQEMVALAPAFEAKGYMIASDPKGVTVFGGSKSGADFAKEVRELTKSLPNKPEATFGRFEGGYVDYSGAWPQGKGAVTKEMLQRVDAAPTTRGLLGESVPFRDAVVARNARDLEAQAKGFGVAREDVLRAREIFAKEGWDGLRRAAEKGIVPAVLATPAVSGLLGESPTGG